MAKSGTKRRSIHYVDTSMPLPPKRGQWMTLCDKSIKAIYTTTLPQRVSCAQCLRTLRSVVKSRLKEYDVT